VEAEELVVRNANGSARVVTISPAVSVNIGTAGANGLDTGAAANSTWYYLWVIVAADGTVAGLLSASSSNPTMPTGYTHKALVGAVRRDGAGNFMSFYQHGREVWLTRQTVFTAKTAVAANTYEALTGADLTAFQGFVPPIAKLVQGYCGAPVTRQMSMAVAADANGLGEVMAHTHNDSLSSTFDSLEDSAFYRVPLKTAQLIYWKSLDNSSARNNLYVTGFTI
jgi:hypothetical protein